MKPRYRNKTLDSVLRHNIRKSLISASSTTIRHEVADLIFRQIKLLGLNRDDISKQCGIARPILRNLDPKTRNRNLYDVDIHQLDIIDFVRICKIIDIDPRSICTLIIEELDQEQLDISEESNV